jgi:hypothetical protein
MAVLLKMLMTEIWRHDKLALRFRGFMFVLSSKNISKLVSVRCICAVESGHTHTHTHTHTQEAVNVKGKGKGKAKGKFIPVL